jgi:hypothetical protein
VVFVSGAGDGAEEPGGAFLLCEVPGGRDEGGERGGGGGLWRGGEERFVVGAERLGLFGGLLGEGAGGV